MNTQQEMEDRLWDHIDGFNAPAGRSEIERLIETHIEWREKYRELLEVHQLMSETELDSPSMRFTKNVMEEIAKFQVAPATKTYINKNIIRGIGAFFGIMILGFLVYLFAQLRWTGNNSDTLLPLRTGPVLNWGKLASNGYVNVFVMINTVLGLMLFDRWLENKKKTDPA